MDFKNKYYFKKNYSNPFVDRKKGGFSAWFAARKQFFALIFLLIIIVAWIYIAFYKNFLDLKYVSVNGAEIIAKDQIISLVNDQKSKKILLIIPQKNIFLFSEKQLERELNNRFGLKKLDIKKNILDRSLEINLEERISAITYVINDQYYYLDLDGFAITNIAKEMVNKNFPIIFNQISSKSINLGQNTLPKILIDSIFKILDLTNNSSISIASFNIVESPQISIKTKLEEPPNEENTNTTTKTSDEQATNADNHLNKNTNADLSNTNKEIKDTNEPLGEPLEIIEIEKETNPNYSYEELTAVTKEGWKIYFGHQFFEDNRGLNNLINRLLIVIKEKISKARLRTLEYIDLRFGERVYYK